MVIQRSPWTVLPSRGDFGSKETKKQEDCESEDQEARDQIRCGGSREDEAGRIQRE